MDLNAPCSIRSRPPAPANPQLSKGRKPASWLTKERTGPCSPRPKADLAAEVARGEKQKATFDANDKQLTELTETLRQRSGNMGEMFGVLRQFAGEFKGSSMPPPAGSNIPSRLPC